MWTREECRQRIDALLELKFEISGGRLFWSEDTRQMVLAMLLENVGLDAAVRIGDPGRWREAIAALDAPNLITGVPLTSRRSRGSPHSLRSLW